MELLTTAFFLGIAGFDVGGALIAITILAVGTGKKEICIFALSNFFVTILVGVVCSLFVGKNIVNWMTYIPDHIVIGIEFVIAVLLLILVVTKLFFSKNKDENFLAPYVQKGIYSVGVVFAVAALMDPSFLALITLSGQYMHWGNIAFAFAIWVLISQLPCFALTAGVLFWNSEQAIAFAQESPLVKKVINIVLKIGAVILLLLALTLLIDVFEYTNAEETGNTVPYTLRIERADQSIYEGPGYDYIFVDTVRECGAYTIVEEAADHEGNLWGKLKSGVGWVDLTELQSEAYANALISANYADENLILHGAYHHYVGDDSEYAIHVAFRAYGTLQNVVLFAYEFGEEYYVPGEELFTLSEMTEDMPLVAKLSFPGDMSMYGIRFDDETGSIHVYSIYISGRNGALILVEE